MELPVGLTAFTRHDNSLPRSAPVGLYVDDVAPPITDPLRNHVNVRDAASVQAELHATDTPFFSAFDNVARLSRNGLGIAVVRSTTPAGEPMSITAMVVRPEGAMAAALKAPGSAHDTDCETGNPHPARTVEAKVIPMGARPVLD